MRRGCDRLWAIDALRDRRLTGVETAAFERHLRTCAECADTSARNERLRELVAALPQVAPTPLDLRRLRSRILRDAAEHQPPAGRARLAFAFVVAFSLVVAAVVVAPPARWPGRASGGPSNAHAAVAAGALAGAMSSEACAFAGDVLAQDGARWSRQRDAGVERLRLDEGTLAIRVRHQRAGERFFVTLPDGEIEVRGTRFEVVVRAGATRRVTVDEGVVSLRVGGGDAMALVAGTTWSASPAPEATGAAVRGPEPKRREATPRALADDDGAEEYAGALAAMSAGHYATAADALHRYTLAHPRASQAEDASYLEAAALARAGRADAAALTAERHLQAYPRSFHRRDAAILIARAARDRGDCPHALAVLAPWVQARDEDAEAAVRACAGSTR